MADSKTFRYDISELLGALAEETSDTAWLMEDEAEVRKLADAALAEKPVVSEAELARLIVKRQKRAKDEKKEKEDRAEFERRERESKAKNERSGRFVDRYNLPYDDYGVDRSIDSSVPPPPSSPTSLPQAIHGQRDRSGHYVSQLRKNPVLCERLAEELDRLYVTASNQPYLVMSGALFELPQLFANSEQLDSCIRNDRTLTLSLIQSYSEIKGRMLREYYEMRHYGREHALRYLDKMFEHMDACLAATGLIAVGRHERQDVPPKIASLISSLRTSMQVRSMMHQHSGHNHDRDDDFDW